MSVVITDFLAITGAWEGAEQLLSQLNSTSLAISCSSTVCIQLLKVQPFLSGVLCLNWILFRNGQSMPTAGKFRPLLELVSSYVNPMSNVQFFLPGIPYLNFSPSYVLWITVLPLPTSPPPPPPSRGKVCNQLFICSLQKNGLLAATSLWYSFFAYSSLKLYLIPSLN